MYPRTQVGVPDVPATLLLVDGCLVIDTGTDRRTAMWQASDALDLSDRGKVTVLDRLSGVRVAAGDAIVLMGLQLGEEQVPEDVVGTDGCPGPYRVVRGFLPRAVWKAQRREGGIASRARELGDPARAAADYEADQARLPRLRAWRERMLSGHGDVVAAIWIDEQQGTAHLFHTAATTREQLVAADLRPFVTAQQVPVGHRVLEAARASLERQLPAAGLIAELEVEPIGGVVQLRPADPRALSAAAVAGRIRFPKVTRIGFAGAMPLSDDRERMARDPEATWRRLEAAPDFAEIRRLVEATLLPMVEPAPPPRPGAVNRRPPQAPRTRYARPSRAASLQTAHFLVTAFYSITHVQRELHSLLFRRIGKWLAPGGIFLASLGARDCTGWLGTWLGAEMFFSHFGAETNLHLLRSAGFQILSQAIVGEDEDGTVVEFLWAIAQKPPCTK